jgi:putative membrane-bound dehydrogenase-like protein
MRKALLSLILLSLVTGVARSQVLTGKLPIVPVPNRNIKDALTPEEQKKHFQLPEGFEVELVAAEPLVINPVTMAFDDKGRLYVSESHTYRYGPSGSPVKPFRNPVVRLDPLPEGKGFKRVLVADGFDDPVMGIAARGDKLWLTANNYMYLYDLADDGTPGAPATNRRTLLTDKNKAWNPFGMFVLEFGPDGMLYMSVGNHGIDIGGPTNRVQSRGGSGIIVRMKPDGSALERLVQGLRVPYSFEFDPFGQLWLLSNGEGNPDRFVRVIEGVDYHCYSRGGADNVWLAGAHPLAPPCFENLRGAHTQLIRYYGAAFPNSYQGSLLLDNWGAHGFNGPNRAILRFVPDARGTIVRQEALLACADPRFRPSHIVIDPDGNLLVADWYGRDDESDMTGRIWRVKYTGKESKPTVSQRLDAADWSRDDYALAALGSPHHLIREKATRLLVERKAVGKLSEHAAAAKEPLGAAGSLWALVQIGTPEATAALASGTKNGDARVRRLAVELLHRYKVPSAAEISKRLSQDEDPAVLVAAARTLPDAGAARVALRDALRRGAAADPHLRYEAAWHLARHADRDTLVSLLKAEDANLRLPGLIAIDVACYERFASRDDALAVLSDALAAPAREEDLDHLLTLAKMNWDNALTPALQKLLTQADTPAPAVARALLLLRTKSSVPPALLASAGKRLLEAVDKGAFPLTSTDRVVVYLEFLEAEGATPAGLKQLERLITTGSTDARREAHELARKFGPKAAALSDPLWPKLLDTRARPEDRIELVATLAAVDVNPTAAHWEKLLSEQQQDVRAEVIRTWRAFKGKPELVAALSQRAPELIKQNPALGEDLAAVLTELGGDLKAAGLTRTELSKEALAEQTMAALAKMPGNERQRRTRAGRLVFERGACTKCHTAVNRDTPLAPSLKGVGKGQKPDYLAESVLYPSKIIKTGFETERIVTKSGKTLTGLVKDQGSALRVLNLDGEVVIPKKDIEEREVQKISLMPEGQEKQLSRQEFLDLIVYLQSLR